MKLAPSRRLPVLPNALLLMIAMTTPGCDSDGSPDGTVSPRGEERAPADQAATSIERVRSAIDKLPIRAWEPDLWHRKQGFQSNIKHHGIGDIPTRWTVHPEPTPEVYEGPLPGTPATPENIAGLWTCDRLLAAEITEYTYEYSQKPTDEKRAHAIITGLFHESMWSFRPRHGQVFGRFNDDGGGGGFQSVYKLMGVLPDDGSTRARMRPENARENYNVMEIEPLLVEDERMVMRYDGYFVWSSYRVESNGYVLLYRGVPGEGIVQETD